MQNCVFIYLVAAAQKHGRAAILLEALKSLEIDNTCHFIGTEHPIHRRFQELNGDVSSNFSPDVVSTEFLNPRRISFG
jgi:hypothetical protein